MKANTVSYPLRISEEIMQITEIRKREEHVDKTTALRQLLYKGVEDYVLELYASGRITLTRTAELLNKNVHEVLQLAGKKGVKTGANSEQQRQSAKTAEKLF
ncbi:MAG: hypothetical protein Q7S92_05660 [Candidatus Diapherotrites archaeon]|nr:hypothetical protein [Candidatus Diapherotrites archaeon]